MGQHNSTTTPKFGSHPGREDDVFGKAMLLTVGLLFAVVSMICCVRGWLQQEERRRFMIQRLISSSVTSVPDGSTVIDLPAFIYSGDKDGAWPSPLDCSICLSEFTDGERGRILPKCGHAFHCECIDMWLRSHVTCPLCRGPVEADGCKSVVKDTGDVIIRVDEDSQTEPGAASQS